MKQVFVVEDNKKNMKLFKAILNLIDNIEVHEATRGDEGLEAIESTETVPDLIILDIQLPEISGIEICKKLREQEEYEDVIMIAVTSFAMKGDKERIMSAGFDEYISKPIKVADFRALIESYLSD
ncbi:MAG: response regulator [Promethearchaeia archaeon]